MSRTNVPGPAHSLPEIQRLLREGPPFRLGDKRGLFLIMAQRRCDTSEAREFAMNTALSVVERNYAETHKYTDGKRGDVYGKVIDEDAWYVKLGKAEAPERADVMSCHLAERPLDTLAGRIANPFPD